MLNTSLDLNTMKSNDTSLGKHCQNRTTKQVHFFQYLLKFVKVYFTFGLI